MRNLVLLFLLQFSTIFLFGQKWGVNTFSQFTNEAFDVEIDASGNAYIAGYATGETAFNTTNILQVTPGNSDIYVAKYNSTGALVWWKQFGGSFSDRAYDLAIGSDQNLVITGQFFGSVNFGSVNLQSAQNSKDIFLLKLNPSGNVIWARKEGGNLAENAYGVTVDNQNNVILTGQFEGTTTIANQNFTSITDPFTNLPSFDLFISKYDSNGNPLWVKAGLAKKEDRGLAVAVDAQDNIFLSGQYSDTLQFAGNTYTNNGYNVGFITKLSPTGQVQFFNNLRAGSCLPYDLEVNLLNQVVVIGDFLGNLNYFHNNTPNPIVNPHSKKIFALKIDNNGQFLWSNTLGSANDLSARSVSIDSNNDIYITGYFSCALTELHVAQTSLWNSVGFKDPYLLKLSNSGIRKYAKQIGGQKDDEGHGVAIKTNDEPILCGSFTKDLNFSLCVNSPSIPFGSNYSLNYEFTGVSNYFLKGDDTRNSFLAKFIDSTSIDYNYFRVPTTDSIEGTINYFTDTVHFCESTSLMYDPLTFMRYGPSYTYSWSNGQTINPISISSTNDFSVIVARIDGCASEQDSIVAVKDPTPTLPLLTDTLGIFVNKPGPDYGTYHFCYPDTIGVYYTNLQAGTTLTTTEPNGNVITGVGTNIHSLEGVYNVNVTNGLCFRNGVFKIEYDYITPPDTILLGIILNNPPVYGDSISICQGEIVSFRGINLLTNPTPPFYAIQPYYDSEWHINGAPYNGNDSSRVGFYPTTTGWYQVDFELILGYNNLCGIDTLHFLAADSFYIEVKPRPQFNASIQGDNLLCPNGSIFLKVNPTHPSLGWSGPGISWISSNQDSVEINLPGNYHYSGIITDSINGCTKEIDELHQITLKQAPTITSNPSDGYICPDDSLVLSLPSSYLSYQWVGPEGDTLSTINTCYGSDAGFYYCHVTDSELCNLTSPPFEAKEYMTPSILVYPDVYMCEGESITIEVLYVGNAVFQWSPIPSSASQLIVNQPGTYSVTIQQCGITITESVTIIDATPQSNLTTTTTILCYQDVAVITGSLSNGSYNWSNGVDGNNSLVVTEPGVYSATVTNEFGCTSQTNELLISAVEASTPPLFDSLWVCSGTNVNLQDSTNFTLNWYALDTTFLFSGSQLSLTNIQSDTTFLVAYDAGGCSPVFTPVFVGVINAIGNFSLTADTMMCLNEQVTISYQGDSDLTFEWFNGNTTNNNVIVNQPGTYTITVSQCEFQATESITIYNASFTAQITASENYLCPGSEIILQGTPANLNYSWNGITGNSSNVTINSPGTYSAFVTNQYGCTTTTNSIQITYAPNSLPPVVHDTLICLGSSLTLSDSLLQTINWYTVDSVLISSSPTLTLSNVLVDTSFLVSQTNSICELIYATVYVDVIDPSIPIQISGDSSLCPNTDLIVFVDAPGDFTWSLPNGQTNSTNNPLTIPFGVLQNAATISVSVQNQCFTQTVSDTIIYLVPDSIHLANDSLVICSYDTAPITSIETMQDIAWSGNFGITNSISLDLNSSFDNGYIYAQGIDLNGCTTNRDSVYLTTSTLNFSIITDTSHQCLGDLGFINVVTSADSLVWNTPIGVVDTNYISIVYNSVYDGNYNLTLWDDIGCVYQETVSISYNQIPTFNLNDTIMCLNEVYQNYSVSDTLNYSWTVFGDTNQITITDNQDLILTATTAQGCYYSDTVHVVVVNCTDELPNVITANGDGINDFFVIDEALKFPNNRLVIMNRWGNVILDEEAYKNTFSGLDASSGVYYFFFYRNSSDKPEKAQKGFLHIIR